MELTAADQHNPPDSPQILRTPADGVPEVIADPAGLRDAAAALTAADGPIAVDAERASGHRYHQRAYLIQVRREGAGTHLIDPVALDDVAPLAQALAQGEWILHAATQDLPCLRELGLQPPRLFDTELAGRLLGLPRVGLAGLAEDLLGVGLAKGHGAADWSRRPLPHDWLSYAALDVELLVELREDLLERLRRADRLHWAEQEFTALLTWQPRPQPEGWRRLRGLNRLREPRDLAVARQLWLARDTIAQRADQPPARILPDTAIIAAARARPASRDELAALPDFARQRRALPSWWRAVEQAGGLDPADLPQPQPAEGIPPHRSWPNHSPRAADLLSRVRPAISTRAEQVGIAHEVLVPPDAVRSLVWHHTDDRLGTAEVSDLLESFGARPWQIELVAADIVAAWSRET